MSFEILLYVLIFLLAIIAIVVFAFALYSRKICAEKQKSLSEYETLLANANSEIEKQRTELENKAVENAIAKTECNNAQNRLQEVLKEMSQIEEDKSKIQQLSASQASELKFLRETLQENEQRYLQLRKQLNDDFQILATKVFDSTREKFATEGAEKISVLVEPLKENIKDFRSRVESIHDAEIKASAKVSEQIESLLKMNTRLSDEAHNLSTALRSNNKVAGNWGEIVLERIFEESGLIKDIHYRTQVNFSDSTTEQSRLMPDFIVDLPDNRSIIVDSKLSLVDYTDYCASDNTEQKRLCLEKFKKSVRAHLREFAKKYNAISSVASFKLMFMPVEPAYNLIVETDKSLLSDAYRENVIIVSPISVMAILKYAQIAYRSEAFAKNIGELSKQGRYLCERIEKFLKNFNSIQERINALQKSFDDSKKTLSEGSQSVANTAQRFYDLSLKALDSQGKKIETDTENE